MDDPREDELLLEELEDKLMNAFAEIREMNLDPLEYLSMIATALAALVSTAFGTHTGPGVEGYIGTIEELAQHYVREIQGPQTSSLSVDFESDLRQNEVSLASEVLIDGFEEFRNDARRLRLDPMAVLRREIEMFATLFVGFNALAVHRTIAGARSALAHELYVTGRVILLPFNDKHGPHEPIEREWKLEEIWKLFHPRGSA